MLFVNVVVREMYLNISNKIRNPMETNITKINKIMH